jgi:hypothetical protein
MYSPSGSPQLESQEIAAIDQNMQAALDKSFKGGTAYGTITLGAGGKVSLDSPSSQFVVSGTGATTATGGRIKCGNNDFPVRSAPVNVRSFVSAAEMFSNLNGFDSAFWPAGVSPTWKWYVDPAGSIYAGTNAAKTPNGAAIIPLTRLSDGQSFVDVQVNFLVSASNRGGAYPPGRFPGARTFRYDPFLNVTTPLSDWTYFTAPVSLIAYQNGGNANLLTVAATGTIEVSKYLYFVAILDEDYAGDVVALSANEFAGVQPLTTSVDLRFQ